ncbi:Type II site-specific deoxyribonuclease [Bifidobacterium reuteri DSM 23975]|uniref:Type II site-specific deoxyribonuclease n=1 Tax=Bifidobacterium reuteri DSM 23975 TaxID=1437610 RepID=A0A087CF45_9BIFI|nr:Eco57I restriction-modification methylase domain-containing protein [Bifidobacterium reuteri]KFI81895.1 Type II site-specific deoxyribonuclease [Bifidobacterium reuteri DSM 23975]
MKKFYAIIGNPPYQEETDSNGRKQPIYNIFMDASYKVGNKVELITPGRFLFNAGQTPVEWNEKMLSDAHLKVLSYESNASTIFSGTDIKGGIAITLHDSGRDIGPIHVFTIYPELNSIIQKVDALTVNQKRLNVLFASQRLYKLSDKFFHDNANDENVKAILKSGTRTKITSSFIEKMDEVFTQSPIPKADNLRFLARIAGKRQWRYVPRFYIRDNDYLDSFKLFIPEANNSGQYGEILAEPVIGKPGEGTADTFLNAGPFVTMEEVVNLSRYYRTKFFRGLLGARKVTQHSPSQVWEMIPMQDFTSSSDIDWMSSVSDVDNQLYRKYGLTTDEIAFIESHVKEMD